MPRERHGRAGWLVASIDGLGSAIVLAAVLALSGAAVLPALAVAPLALVGVVGACGGYRGIGSQHGAGPPAVLAVLVLAAGLCAWFAGLLAQAFGPHALTVAAQLGLWAATVAITAAARGAAAPALRRLRRPERWVVVGDEATTDLLLAYEPLRDYASIVCAVAPSDPGFSSPDRSAALGIVEHHRADRVVIASQAYDDEGLLELIRTFCAVGVQVSLLPRPLDLLEARPTHVEPTGGLGLTGVGALSARDQRPYTGPDRRRERRTRVSVVVPAINEADNIGHVLERLPADLHEVILVDGNSKDTTIDAAREACPDIRVLTQSGRGKGDALRTGFAAVTGNLVVMLDADGSADPAEIPRFVEALEDGADFAKGSRFLSGGGSADITAIRQLGNRFLTGTANLLHGTRFTDLCYGYNAFWARCLPFISLDVPGFEVETLINLRIAGAGMRIIEVASFEESRLSGKSNLNAFSDGWRILGTIVGEVRHRRAAHGVAPALDSRREAESAASTNVA